MADMRQFGWVTPPNQGKGDDKAWWDQLSQERRDQLTSVANDLYGSDKVGAYLSQLGQPAPPPVYTPPKPTYTGTPSAGLQSGRVFFDDAALGQMPEQYRPLLDTVMRRAGFRPTGVFGNYGNKEYQLNGSFYEPMDQTIASTTEDPTARAWLNWAAWKHGLTSQPLNMNNFTVLPNEPAPTGDFATISGSQFAPNQMGRPPNFDDVLTRINRRVAAP